MKGFSLIELLISISILAAITVFTVTNLVSSPRNQELKSNAADLASLFRKAQIWSLTGHQVNGQVPNGGYGLSIPACGTAPCKVRLFADLDGSLTYNSAGNLLGTPATNPTEEKIEELVLSKFVTVAPPGIGVDLLFKPPQGLVCLYDTASVQCPPASSNVIFALAGLGDYASASFQVQVSTVSGQVTTQ